MELKKEVNPNSSYEFTTLVLENRTPDSSESKKNKNIVTESESESKIQKLSEESDSYKSQISGMEKNLVSKKEEVIPQTSYSITDSSQKIKPEGLMQICKIIDTSSTQNNPLFYCCALLFQDEGLAKKFMGSFNQHFENNVGQQKIMRIRLFDSDEPTILGLLFDPRYNSPPQWPKLVATRKVIPGKVILDTFAKYCDISGIPQVFMNRDGDRVDINIETFSEKPGTQLK